MKKMTQVALASIKIYMLALFFIVTAEAAPHISDYSGARLHQKDLEREKGVATGVCPDDRNHFCTIDKDKQGDAQQDVQIPHKTLDGSKQGFDHHDGEIFNKTHLDKSSTKLNSVKSPEENLRGKNGVASGNLDHFPVAPKTNKLGQASRNSSDAVAPRIESLRQAQRNTHDGIAPNTNALGQGSRNSSDAVSLPAESFDSHNCSHHINCVQQDNDEIINTNGVSESNPFALTDQSLHGNQPGMQTQPKLEQLSESNPFGVTAAPLIPGANVKTDNHRLEVPMDRPGRP